MAYHGDGSHGSIVKYVAKLGLRKYNLGVSYQIFKEGKV